MGSVTVMELNQWDTKSPTTLKSTSRNGRIKRTYTQSPSGLKAKGKVKISAKSKDTETVSLDSNKDSSEEYSDKKINNTVEKKRHANESEKSGESVISRKMPKRAAACSDFKEKSIRLSEETDMVETRKDRLEDNEVAAVKLTSMGLDDFPPNRRLVDLVIHDENGVAQPFEMSEVWDLYISALIMPLDQNAEREKGIRCEGFGRIESWSISGYEEGSPVIWVSTETAEYECAKPASCYRNFFDLFFDKAQICIEVFKRLSRSSGGNPNMGFDELLAAVVRAMTASKSFSGGSFTKDFVIYLGDFIYNQLVGLDGTSKKNDEIFSGLPVLVELKNESKKMKGIIDRSPPKAGSLKIKDSAIQSDSASSDSPSVTLQGNEDEKIAQLLQEEELWKTMKQKKNRKHFASPKYYINLKEDEIANDYPLPAFYKTSVQEMDEYIFFDSVISSCFPDELPRSMLHNWSLYNSDSRLIPLELLPMKPCAEVDVTIFGSGTMTDDDGSGFCLDTDPVQASGASSGNKPASVIDQCKGIPIYLSAIKEWMIEFGASMVFISIRTDVAWYRLGKPSKQYAPWYKPVLKTATLAISIITLLKEQNRVSRLSFSDVVKTVAEFEKDHPAHIASNPAAVERYVIVHGQIILQLFTDYPDEMIRKCAFITGLSDSMEQRHHTKLVMKKKIAIKKEVNLNPRAALGPETTKKKPMRATTTQLINRIWGEYYSSILPEDAKEAGTEETKPEEEEEEQEENEDDEDEEKVEEETILPAEKAPSPASKQCKSKSSQKELKWVGNSIGKLVSGEVLYRSASVRGETVILGGAVLVDSVGSEDLSMIVFVEYMFERSDATKMVHGRVMQRGSQTVLGNAANPREVFLTNDCLEFELGDVKQTVAVEITLMSWGHHFRKENAAADKTDRERAEERTKKGLPLEYYCKSLYWPEKGAFYSLPFDTMGIGNGVCQSCLNRERKKEGFEVNSDNSGFLFKKTVYHVHDFVYVNNSQWFATGMDEDRETFKAGRNVGLKPFVVCQLLEIEASKSRMQADVKSTKLKVKRFYRPDDIGSDKAYVSDIREVYYSEEIHIVPVESIEGKCEVRKQNDLPTISGPVTFDHIFFCEYIYDPTKGTIKQLPANVRLQFSRSKAAPSESVSKKNKGKGKCIEEDDAFPEEEEEEHSENCLKTLDIFAGCGGLSEGLQQSGAAITKWAIEYDEAAADAFILNHPAAYLFVDNCNVILRAIMEKCGDLDDCICTTEAAELAQKLSEGKRENLPTPGQVDFINGGPPCQGFSGMNRFSQGTWSKVQCEMILAFLSFADYFRPRFFLLENVRNFVSFNKGQTFRLTLASLLEMGYQVRFGILEAGNYGVSQSRKRAFIWAASPEETLPEWPEPMYVFGSPLLKITLPGNIQYAAVRSTACGAPFRSITVRDTIGDLPPVQNGANENEMTFIENPVSWFQKQIRGAMLLLTDHISKEMNELNLKRCQRIPKRPGADWHDLPDEKVKLSSGQCVDLIPWCLPNTAKRHNQWKGLFGRLDWEGNFPTSITDPQPMGKVGMCFHPDQDRIITVRECARSQGFMDSYYFSGNIQSKHRQIGNAVPPPLAMALGRKLKEVLDAKSPPTREEV